MISEERMVLLEGCLNFRDLGGYRAWHGTTVRWRRLFRSVALGHVTDEDRRELDKLGLVTVVDFRRKGEHEVPGGDVIGVGGNYKNLALFEEAPSIAEIASWDTPVH
jgi:Tyrosine phosphatase family